MVALLAADVERRGVTNASVRQMDAAELAVPDSSFDVVVSNYVLHLLVDPPGAAGELLRVLLPGGRCAVSAAVGDDPDWQFFGRLVRRFAPQATQGGTDAHARGPISRP